MPGVFLGNNEFVCVVTIVADVGSLSADTTTEATLTVPGVEPGDFVVTVPQAEIAGVGVVASRVTTANEVIVTFLNATASPVDPSETTYLVSVTRPTQTVAAVTY